MSAHKRTLAAGTHATLLSAREELLGELQIWLKLKFALSPRLGWDRLILPKQKGGIGLPDLDLFLYHKACLLARIVDWHVHKGNKGWVRVEDAFSRTPVSHLPWINPCSIPRPFSSHPLIGPTMSNFRVICRSFDTIPSPGPMIPLTQNPDFPTDVPAHDHAVIQSDSTMQAHLFF